MSETHLAFSLSRCAVRDRVLIPKYYDPDLKAAAALASASYDLTELGSILLSGAAGSRLGDWIRREHYGTGRTPYVRTSDLAQWSIRPDYKKGVAQSVYESLRERQDVRVGDLLMVAHGTYLVGTVAMVGEGEEKLVLQDHIFRLRTDPASEISPFYLLAALSTDFVRRQVRARQFSADIIDKIGERHLSILVPIVRDKPKRAEIAREVESILTTQRDTRRRLREATGSDFRMTRERSESRHGFAVPRTQIQDRVLVPKYYDPVLEHDLSEEKARLSVEWRPLGDLIRSGELLIGTGVEVGKMAYGTGDIPFVRTTDIVDWEVRATSRHGVSRAIYEKNAHKAGLSNGDILVVRDGTYLVGSSAIVAGGDLPALICGGLYRLRVADNAQFNSFALMASLNLPIVRRQMRARQFTRDVIDTLGTRLVEVRIPSLASTYGKQISEEIASVMEVKDRIKGRIKSLVSSLDPPAPPILRGRPSWSMR